MEIQHHGLVLRPQKKHQWVMGSQKATRKLGADAGEINRSGDWRKWAPTPEEQKRYGFETQACVSFAILKALITLAKFKGYEIPHNLSERYTANVTDTTLQGNDPWKVAELTATRFGLLAEDLLPWSDSIRDWMGFYSPTPMDELLVAQAQKILRKYEIEPEWVIPPRNNFSPKEKAERIRAALKRGTVVASVRAWEKKGSRYTKDVGASDTHLVMIQRNEEVHDQYEPFIKKLEPEYDHEAAIVFFMRPNPTGIAPFERSPFQQAIAKLISALKSLFPLIRQVPQETRFDVPVEPLPEAPKPPVVVPVEPQAPTLSWEVPKEAYKLTRIMCDELGLTVEQKNIVCACIYQESRFRNHLANGQPTKGVNRNAAGKITSTDWGIAQVNDTPGWHIGPGLRYPSIEYVLAHPEEPVRWMVQTMKKTGRLQPWSSYTGGAYKQWLINTSPMWRLKS